MKDCVMEYVTLPGTKISASRLTFGAEPLGGTDWGSFDESQTFDAVQRALDLGINIFDTADVYGLGRSETSLSQALGYRRHDVIIVTKFGVNWHTTDSRRAQTFLDSSPARITVALEGSLRRLRIECIPIYLVHWPDPKVPIADTIQALLDCQKAGKVQHIGVSNYSALQLIEASQVADLTVAEMPYSLISPQVEEDLLPISLKLNIGVLAYGCLAQGLLTGKYDLNTHFPVNDRRHRLPSFKGAALQENLYTVERVKKVAGQMGKSASQVAIRWVLDQPVVSSAIVGIKDVKQLEANLGALEWQLSDTDRDYLRNGNAESLSSDI